MSPDGKPPYSNMKEYAQYKSKAPNPEVIQNLQDEEDV
jgi:hypothetical protein